MTTLNTLTKVSTALVGGLLTLGTPAMAGYVTDDGYTIMTAESFTPAHAPLVQALTEAGVPIVDGNGQTELPQCKVDPKSQSVLMGFYAPAFNIVVLCTDNFNSKAQLSQTLTHEAVHLVQDASVGLDNEGIETIGNWKSLVPDLSEDHVYAIENFYPQEQWGLEVEARTLETEPEIVTNLVKKFVF